MTLLTDIRCLYSTTLECKASDIFEEKDPDNYNVHDTKELSDYLDLMKQFLPANHPSQSSSAYDLGIVNDISLLKETEPLKDASTRSLYIKGNVSTTDFSNVKVFIASREKLEKYLDNLVAQKQLSSYDILEDDRNVEYEIDNQYGATIHLIHNYTLRLEGEKEQIELVRHTLESKSPEVFEPGANFLNELLPMPLGEINYEIAYTGSDHEILRAIDILNDKYKSLVTQRFRVTQQLINENTKCAALVRREIEFNNKLTFENHLDHDVHMSLLCDNETAQLLDQSMHYDELLHVIKADMARQAQSKVESFIKKEIEYQLSQISSDKEAIYQLEDFSASLDDTLELKFDARGSVLLMSDNAIYTANVNSLISNAQMKALQEFISFFRFETEGFMQTPFDGQIRYGATLLLK
jgi:hypothetical protein